MTPEERLDRIEQLLEKTAEQQARHQDEIANLITVQHGQREEIDKQNEGIQKQNEGIQGLIVVARTVLTSLQETRTSIDGLRDAQREMIEEVRELHKHTDEKLNILIDTVDRIVRHRNGKE